MTSHTPFEFTVAANDSAVVHSPVVLVRGAFVAAVEIENDAAADVSAFTVQARDHVEGEWYDLIGGASPNDFSDGIGNNILFVSSTLPGATGTGTKTHAHVRANGVESIRFGIELASGTGNVVVRGGMISL